MAIGDYDSGYYYGFNSVLSATCEKAKEDNKHWEYGVISGKEDKLLIENQIKEVDNFLFSLEKPFEVTAKKHIELLTKHGYIKKVSAVWFWRLPILKQYAIDSIWIKADDVIDAIWCTWREFRLEKIREKSFLQKKALDIPIEQLAMSI